MAKRIRFFLLDIAYKIIDDKPVIYLFGKTLDNNQVCVIDEKFQPYLWVIPNNKEELKKELERLRANAQITDFQISKKRYFGEDIEAIKVFTRLPKEIPLVRNELKRLYPVKSVNEYDIPVERRYLIDKGIIPLSLLEAEGNFIESRIKIPVFKAESLNKFSEDTLNMFNILAFDIEVYNPYGKYLVPEENPVIMLSFYGQDFERVITWKKFKTNNKKIEFVEGESSLIQKFIDTIDNFKPDIIVGYFSDGFDLPYLKKRADKYKLRLDIGLDNSGIEILKDKTKIIGITHLDIFKFILKVMGRSFDTESYKLGSIAEELLGEKKRSVDLGNLADVWDNKPEELEKYCEYNLHDSFLAYKLCEKILPNIIELVKIIGLPIFDINRMGFSQLVESYLIRQGANLNIICPNKPNYDEIRKRRQTSFKGAFVYEPKPGMYNDIIVYDYKSLYPTIISSHNISPDTLNCNCCKDDAKTITIDKKGYWFCLKNKGFIPSVIEDIITRRMRIKEIIKNDYSPILAARSEGLKILANSMYGYYGFFGARWYSIECAKSVTAYGRNYISMVIEEAKKDGFNVVYSDTDSTFLALGEKSKKDAERFAERINLGLPELMELEYEGFYPKGIFVSAKVGAFGAKKKYALLSDKGIIKIRGFESVRRNWSSIAKEVQLKVFEMLLKEENKEKALSYVKGVILDLKNKKVPLEKVTIQTQLQKEVSEYDNIAPHVAVALRMKKQGMLVGPGTLVKYVVKQGSEKISERARLPNEVSKDEYDANYYINNQILPSVEKIFEVIGFKKEDIMETEQSKLGRFF